MRFTALAIFLMIAATVGVTPGLRLDLMQMVGDVASTSPEAAPAPASQQLAGIPRQVLDSLPEAAPPAVAEPADPQRLAVELNDLAPAAGGESELGAVQVAALPPVNDPLHDTDILRLSELAPAAPRLEPPALDDRVSVPGEGFALFVAIGSYDGLREAAEVVRRHADWDPMIHRAVMNERMRHVVVLGPFESGDVGAVLKRLRDIGIAEPWPLAVQLRPGLAVKGLDLFG